MVHKNLGSWWVKDLTTDTLYVGQGFHHPALYATSLDASEIHLQRMNQCQKRFKCTAKFRYRQQDVPGNRALIRNNRAEVIFDRPVRAIPPGKPLFYDGMECLGGGLIDHAYQETKVLQYV